MSSHGKYQLPPGTKILERLVDQALITQRDKQQAILQAQQSGQHCEDALVDLGAMAETDLLKWLASTYHTRFVTTAKLERARIDLKLLKLVPRRLAEKIDAFPIMFDAATQTLSVVAADLTVHDIAKQIQMISGVRDVRVYIARPAAIHALIRKHFDRDPNAFAELAAQAAALQQSEIQHGSGYDRGGPVEGQADSGLLDIGPPPTPPAGAERIPTALSPHGASALATALPVPDGPPQPERQSQLPPPSAYPSAPPPPPLGPSQGDYLETLNVLVALLEQSRGDLRGHSGQVALLCRRVGERMGLSKEQMYPIIVAAYLHDVGKASAYHLTPLNVGRYEGHRVQARKTFLAPVRTLESVRLPDESVRILTHLYERYDGEGFPDELSKGEVPMGSRILAIVETYCDLTTHAKNPFRKVLTPMEACDAIFRYKGSFFDPDIAELFKVAVLGGALESKLLGNRPTVLVVDKDPVETTMLELRLMEHGYEVVIARDSDKALERLEAGGVEVVIAEVDLAPFDGFEMIRRMKASSAADVPFLFVTARGDRGSVNDGFGLGAADYLVKPASADVVAAKTKQLLSKAPQRAARGVSGSLSEMSLPDVVQILSNGRKTGQLSLRSGGRSGKILFVDGMIWDAEFGTERAEEAIYAMLILEDGEFTLDPSVRAEDRHMEQATESLLLEGMRRLDEGRR